MRKMNRAISRKQGKSDAKEKVHWVGGIRKKLQWQWLWLRSNILHVIQEAPWVPEWTWFVASILLVGEAILNPLIIHNVPYTEIDWQAYMEEVEGFHNGTWDYSQLKGSTGPLVYPAGFLYIFLALYYVTSAGKNLLVAQYIFAFIYLATLALVFRLFAKANKVPPYMLAFLCCTSYRIHSIYVLRLFNDPIAMLFLYAALNAFVSNRWSLGSLLFSLGVSVKMNVLLYAPALLAAYLLVLGLKETIRQLIICASVQLILGLPFLLENPVAYINGAFNFGRVFLFKWTVNWRFLPEEVFVSRSFHALLLLLHVVCICIFAYFVWIKCLQSYACLHQAVNLDISCQLFLLPLFTCNFIGICMSRSLHYQFYVWYFHTLPYLLSCIQIRHRDKICLLGLIELCWNVYPSTVWSSLLLHASHLVILVGLFLSRPTVPSGVRVEVRENKVSND